MPKNEDITHRNEPPSYFSFYGNHRKSLENGSTADYIYIQGCHCVQMSNIFSPNGHIKIEGSDLAELFGISGNDCSIELNSNNEISISNSDVKSINALGCIDENSDNQKNRITIDYSKAKITVVSNFDVLNMNGYNVLHFKSRDNKNIYIFDSNFFRFESREGEAYLKNCGLLDTSFNNSNVIIQSTMFPTDLFKYTTLGSPKIRLDDSSKVEFDRCMFNDIEIYIPQDEELKDGVQFTDSIATKPIKLIGVDDENKAIKQGEFYIMDIGKEENKVYLYQENDTTYYMDEIG